MNKPYTYLRLSKAKKKVQIEKHNNLLWDTLIRVNEYAAWGCWDAACWMPALPSWYPAAFLWKNHISFSMGWALSTTRVPFLTISRLPRFFTLPSPPLCLTDPWTCSFIQSLSLTHSHHHQPSIVKLLMCCCWCRFSAVQRDSFQNMVKVLDLNFSTGFRFDIF